MTNQPSEDVPVLTVSQLTNAIKQDLESQFPSIWLEGEVSNCKLHSSGHLYFSLKDSQAQIGAVMFRAHASKMGKVPKDGDSVVVYGGLNVYPPSGKYQIVVQKMRLAGLGELLLKLEELKKMLLKKGYFSKEHKKPLPKFPKSIGVVTSPTGAAIQDMLNILKRRFAGFHLILNPVRVQGEGAAKEIARAIRQFNELDLVDVIIVGRGGGSIEDLWAFNEEVVADAIYHSRLPIIGAVGHETDHCIAEYVADVRAPTPSAAAELVIAEKAQQMDFLEQARKRVYQTVSLLLKQNCQRLDSVLQQPLIRNPYALLGPWMQSLDGFRSDIDGEMRSRFNNYRVELNSRKKVLESLKPTTQIQHFRQKLLSLTQQIDGSIVREFATKKEKLKHLISILSSIDPKNLLKKGYSILLSEDKQNVITSVAHLQKKQSLRMLLSDGEILSTIEEIQSHDRKEKK